jgi:hypothetical protein
MDANTKIYYAKPDVLRYSMMGWEFLKGIYHPLISSLSKRDLSGYQLVAHTTKTDLSDIFQYYQAEVWSSRGEMREYIRELGLNHTSMSVGDLVEIKGVYHFCDSDGWVAL